MEQGFGSEGKGILSLGNIWIMSERKTELDRMMEGLAEEIVSREMEPEQESPWWTGTYAKVVAVQYQWKSKAQGFFCITSFVKKVHKERKVRGWVEKDSEETHEFVVPGGTTGLER